MDHLMPGMDGFQAVQAIKNNPRTATIPIMMYTSQEGELYLGQARALGAVGVLPKQIKHADVSKVLYQLHLVAGPAQPGAVELHARQRALTAGCRRARPRRADRCRARSTDEPRCASTSPSCGARWWPAIDTQTDRITAEVRALLLRGAAAAPPASRRARSPSGLDRRQRRAALAAWSAACSWWRSVQLLERLQCSDAASRGARACAGAARSAPARSRSGARGARVGPAQRPSCAGGAGPLPAASARREDARPHRDAGALRRRRPRRRAARGDPASCCTAWRGRRCTRRGRHQELSPDASASWATRADGYSLAPEEMPFSQVRPGRQPFRGGPVAQRSAPRSRLPTSSARSAAPTHGALDVQVVGRAIPRACSPPYPTPASRPHRRRVEPRGQRQQPRRDPRALKPIGPAAVQPRLTRLPAAAVAAQSATCSRCWRAPPGAAAACSRAAAPLLAAQASCCSTAATACACSAFIVHARRTAARRRVVLLHGWEGSAESLYVLSLAQLLFEQRLRGGAPEPARSRRHPSSEPRAVSLLPPAGGGRRGARACSSCLPARPLHLVGFSLGGNFMLRVAAQARAARPEPRAA